MNSIEKALMVLCRHLERERQCLFDLASLLDDEADALRRMALAELEDYAHRKEVMLNEQRTLARERIALLSTFSNDETPVPLADAISNASGDMADKLNLVRQELLDLAQAIKIRNVQNQTFAATGHGLVTGLFRIIGLGRVNRKSTYAANGRISDHLLARSNSRSLP